jgi:hypothetical protein
MSLVQKIYQGPADTCQIPTPDFKVREQVFVKAKYFCSTHPSKKLSEKNLGPFEIIVHVGSYSITVQLPDLMCSVHPVFHVSQLEPATPNTIPNHIQPPPPPVEVNGEPEYEILSYPIYSRFSSEVPDIRSDLIRSTDPYRIHYNKLLHSYHAHIMLNTAYFLHLVYLPFR